MTSVGDVNCNADRLKNWRGRWTDIVVRANYDLEPDPNGALSVYVNGRLVCQRKAPLITRRIHDVGKKELFLKYGIYHSYVSRWLKDHASRKVQAQAFADKHDDSGITIQSVTNAPFAHDWGIKLPSQIVFYDEMRYGKRREDVDIRILEASGVKPLD